MNPEEAANVARDFERERGRYTAAAAALEVLVRQLSRRAGVAVDSVSARAKEVQSVREKLSRRDSYSGLDSLTDLVGLRVVTRYSSDVDAICAELAREFVVLEDVTHGLDSAEAFGYTSRHLICTLGDSRRGLPEWEAFAAITFEVQVRSILQHAWASISHGLDYKSGPEVPLSVRRKLFRVAALMETGDELFDQFRSGVEAVKLGYAADVIAQRWRELAIDLDSLNAAALEMGLDDLAAVAQSAGWLEADPETPEQETDSRARLVRIANSAGLHSLGELADFVQYLTNHPDVLAAYAARGKEGGYEPYAVPADVAALMLLTRLPSDVVMSAGGAFASSLVEAAVQSPAVALGSK